MYLRTLVELFLRPALNRCMLVVPRSGSGVAWAQKEVAHPESPALIIEINPFMNLRYKLKYGLYYKLSYCMNYLI